MHWIAPTERDTATDTLEQRLWAAADQFRANSGLTAAQYSAPVLGLIFLRFAEARFALKRAELEREAGKGRRGASRLDDPAAYHAGNGLYLTPNARFDHLLALPEGAAIGQALNDAMADIERHNEQLAGVLPRTYQLFTSALLKDLLKKVSEVPVNLDYDAFGRIYEYFLGEFARTEGSKGGEFYTPSSIVRLLVEVIEPFHGRILDPACGSGGMFVQSARFVAEHQRNPGDELMIHGVEKTDETGRLARMNLAVHGLEGDVRHGGHINSYYDDPFEATGTFDFVLANPPFNVNAVNKERLEGAVGPGRRYPFGLPRSDNANTLWIQLFWSALNAKGRAGFVMANSASDARSSEQDIRKQLIEARGVDVMVAVGPNMFYTVTLPCTLWFLDRGKNALPPLPLGEGGGEGAVSRKDSILFIDARHIYRQIDRAHRDWTAAQSCFIANIVRLYRGEPVDVSLGGDEALAKLREVFGAKPRYADVAGLCKAATLAEIEAQGWSLNPGRYVGVAPGEGVSDEDFKAQLEALNEELEGLNAQAWELEESVARNVAAILET
jgi:type I restriction enzyme M protein